LPSFEIFIWWYEKLKFRIKVDYVKINKIIEKNFYKFISRAVFEGRIWARRLHVVLLFFITACSIATTIQQQSRTGRFF
jgi:hypothetical protein